MGKGKKKLFKKYYCMLKSYYHQLMNLPGAPNSLAGGVAIGVAVDFLPIPLIGIVLGCLVARVVGFNYLATGLTAVLFKILVPLFYALNYLTGRLIIGGQAKPVYAMVANLNYIDPNTWLVWLSSLGKPFILGGGINAILAFMLVYLLAKKLFTYRQQKYHHAKTCALKPPQQTLDQHQD